MNNTNKTNWLNKEKKQKKILLPLQKGFCQVNRFKKIQLKKSSK